MRSRNENRLFLSDELLRDSTDGKGICHQTHDGIRRSYPDLVSALRVSLSHRHKLTGYIFTKIGRVCMTAAVEWSGPAYLLRPKCLKA